MSAADAQNAINDVVADGFLRRASNDTGSQETHDLDAIRRLGHEVAATEAVKSRSVGIRIMRARLGRDC